MVYHDFVQDKNMVYTPDKSFTNIGLLSDQMKYLHDNGFTILKMSDLGYNPSNNYIYIKGPTGALMRNC